MIGGVHSNHHTCISGKSQEEITEVLKDCIDGKYGCMADEVKV